MPEQVIKIVIGRDGVGRVAGGGGGGNAASASEARESRARGGGSGGGGGYSALASQFSGEPKYGGSGSGVPFFLDPTNTIGSAVRRGLDAAQNPFLSGGERNAQLQVQLARASAYTPFGAASTALAAMPGMSGASEKAEQIGRAVADAVATVLERRLMQQSMVSGAANQAVGGVAQQYAAAGVNLSDDVIDRLLKQTEAVENRKFEAQVRVANRSGKIHPEFQNSEAMAAQVQGIQRSMGDAIGMFTGMIGGGGRQGVSMSIEEARQIQRGAQANGQINGFPVNR